MDNVTHGLWGLAIYGAWAAATQPAPHAGLAAGVCIAAIVGSEAPDADYVVKLVFGPVAYLRQHRAYSHSIPMWFLWPLAISLILSLFWPGHFGLFYFISLISVVIHIGLDVLTSYGTQALWPLSRRRFSLDALFIVDGVMLLCGLLGVLLAVTGAWAVGHVVFVMGSIVLFYLALRCVQAALLNDRVRKQFPKSWHVSTIPGPVPWRWTFVAQSENELITGKLTLTGEVSREIHWQWRNRPEEAIQFVTRFSKTGKVFHWFARHLIWTESQEGEWWRISLTDATYRYGRKFPLTAHITLKKLESGRYTILKESLRRSPVEENDVFLQDAAVSNTVYSPILRWFSR